MTDWFARPVLHVSDVENSLRFYVDRLGFTSPWRYAEDGITHVAQVDRQGCALILADTWPAKIGKGLMFISLNVEPRTHEAARGEGRFGQGRFVGLSCPDDRRSRRQSALLQLPERDSIE
jgi:catechol 2,3-dioxygenase-like lactoylglutathione lyase family enzyme